MNRINRIRHILWRLPRLRPYLGDMGVGRRGPRVDPVPRARVLDEYAGEWVAIKDDKVIAHSPSSREVVRQMRVLGEEADGAVLQRAATPTEAVAVGLG